MKFLYSVFFPQVCPRCSGHTTRRCNRQGSMELVLHWLFLLKPLPMPRLRPALLRLPFRPSPLKAQPSVANAPDSLARVKDTSGFIHGDDAETFSGQRSSISSRI